MAKPQPQRAPRTSIKGLATKLTAKDESLRKQAAKAGVRSAVSDSFVNFAMKMGVGADNPMSTATYGFNPITRIRTILEWIHRGSWLGGVAVDLVADDMTRAGIELQGELQPKHKEKIEEAAVTLGIWNSLNELIKWARLYGGAIGVHLVDGQDLKTPLRIETIGRGAYRGITVLDRWMVEPSLNDIVQTPGPDMGQPKFYKVITDAPALRGMAIHHTRVIRLEGIRLPYWQRVMENGWGISVIERLYDRMTAFDSATTGAAQLVYKAYLRTYKIKGMREVVSAGGPPLDGLVKYVEMMRRFQGIEGVTLLDGDDEMEAMQHTAFAGLGDALLQFGQQLSGALQIPLVRLFGQSPAGLNSTGESDLRMYYDNIKQQQEKTMRVGVTTVYRCLARSEGTPLPEGSRIDFRSLWQLMDKEKADIAETTTRAVVQAEEAGLVTQAGAMQELQASSRVTGIFATITDEDVAAAGTTLPPAGAEAAEAALELAQAGGDDAGGEGGGDEDEGKKVPKAEDGQFMAVAMDGVRRIVRMGTMDALKRRGGTLYAARKGMWVPHAGGRAADSAVGAVTSMKKHHGVDIVVENPKGSLRQGATWENVMPYDYGYIRQTEAPDGEGVDIGVGPNPASSLVIVISQVRLSDRSPDEPKVLAGFDTVHHALGAYASGYTDGAGLERIGGLLQMHMDDFKSSWLPQYHAKT